jgi:hypothetical protein
LRELSASRGDQHVCPFRSFFVGLAAKTSSPVAWRLKIIMQVTIIILRVPVGVSPV